jgi:hypothetical protein
MEKDIKNRFDEKRPFDVVRAEDFGGDLYEYYEPLEKLIRKVSGVDIIGSRPVFLIGGRGTGKTMVLKFLSLEMQLKDFIKHTLHQNKSPEELSQNEIKDFLKTRNFLGIYLRFKTTEYDQFKGDFSQLFIPYLSIKVAEQLFKALTIFRSSELISFEQEMEITKFFLKQIREPEAKAECNFDSILHFVRETLLPLYEVILEKKSYSSIDEIKKKFYIPVVLAKRIFFELPDFIFKNLDFLRGKNLFVLLDELEYLNDYQTRCIGELIKSSDETSVIFKIGSRYMPQRVPVGESSEVLQEPHDFRVINITDAMNSAHSGRKDDYSKLVKNILNKRLMKSDFFRNLNITDIEQLFPSLPIEQEALELVKGREKHWQKFKNYLQSSNTSEEISAIIELLRYPANPIVEKLNMLLYYRGVSPQEIKKMMQEYLGGKNDVYANLYKKNALNLLFQLCSDYRNEKKYCGIDVFIHLSSGIIRNAIEICNQALNTAYNYGYNPSLEKTIEATYQDIGAKNHARLQYDDIPRISGNLGLDVQDFINQIGTIFRALHEDRYLVEPEPTHFETDYWGVTGKAKEVFDATVRHSYIQKKPPMDPKSYGETRKADFLINRVFAPYFEISYRVRGRTFIQSSEICILITGNEIEKKRVRKAIIKENARKRRDDFWVQRRLIDVLEANKNEAD